MRARRRVMTREIRARDLLRGIARGPRRRNALGDVLDAARLEARFPLSYADAFALATAIRFGATVVTGDPELETAEHLVEIDWI